MKRCMSVNAREVDKKIQFIYLGGDSAVMANKIERKIKLNRIGKKLQLL